jgi:hypothetical protein
VPRGFQRNDRATREALATGFLQDKGSFISQPKIIKGECDEPRPHLLLEGVDKGPIRAEIFRRNRKANDGFCKCWKCGTQVFEEIDPLGSVRDLKWRGEWDHIRNKAGERCDCPENGRVACRKCHKERHPQPQFGKTGMIKEIA